MIWHVLVELVCNGKCDARLLWGIKVEAILVNGNVVNCNYTTLLHYNVEVFKVFQRIV